MPNSNENGVKISCQPVGGFVVSVVEVLVRANNDFKAVFGVFSVASVANGNELKRR